MYFELKIRNPKRSLFKSSIETYWQLISKVFISKLKVKLGFQEVNIILSY